MQPVKKTTKKGCGKIPAIKPKIIDGKKYQFLTSFRSKKRAKQWAKTASRVGAKSYYRIIKGKTSQGNTVYRIFVRRRK